jgi:hypothetical protein
LKIEKEELKMYPNPTDDILHVLFSEQPKGAITIKVYDAMGKKVMGKVESNEDYKLEISTKKLSTGVYNILHKSTFNVLH